MTGHITSVLLIAVAAALISVISPEGEMKKYVKLVSSLAVLAAIIVPMVMSISKLPGMIGESVIQSSAAPPAAGFDLIGESAKKIERSISEQVKNEFGISGDVGASVVLDKSDETEIKILRVILTVPCGTDTAAVREYVLNIMKNTSDVEVREERTW